MATARATQLKVKVGSSVRSHGSDTVAELLRRLGGIPAWRVRLDPPPGVAKHSDLLAIWAREKRRYELVDGVLVEQRRDFDESQVALMLGCSLVGFVRKHRLGIALGVGAHLQLCRQIVRIPDVSFISWDRLPGRKRPQHAIPRLAPDLAVDLLSKGNTPSEMKRKLGEYFQAGTRLVWIVDIKKRTVQAFTSPDDSQTLKSGQALDGGDVLPEFRLALKGLFAPLDE